MLSHINCSQVVKTRTGTSLYIFFAVLTFLWIPVSLDERKSLLRYSVSSPPFPQKSSGGHANHFQGSLYFSFLPAKQRDFPGNVRSGGCDSLPLVVAFTSKQHDSLLSYALHFLHIISHQMCCAGERAECRMLQSVEKSLHLPEKNARKAKSFLRGMCQTVKGSNKSALCLTCRKTETKRGEKQEAQTSQFSIYHQGMST